MARIITTMTRRDVMRNKLREAIQFIEYDSTYGVDGHIGRLDRLFWLLEMQDFPILDNYRIWALIRSLPENLCDYALQTWGRHEGRISYTQLCTELLHYADCEEDPEEDPEEEPEEDPSIEVFCADSIQDSVSCNHPNSISAENVVVQPKRIGNVTIITALVFVLVGVIIAYLV